MMPWRRRILFGVLGLATLSAGTLVAGGLFVHSAWGRAVITEAGVSFLNGRLGGEIGVGRMETDYGSEVVFHEVTLDDGGQLASASTVTVRREGLGISAIEIDGVELTLGVTEDGRVPGLTVLSGELLSLLPTFDIPVFRLRGEALVLGQETVEDLLITGRLQVGASLVLDELRVEGKVAGEHPFWATGVLSTDGKALSARGDGSLLGSVVTVDATLSPDRTDGRWEGRLSGDVIGIDATLPATGTWTGSWLETTATLSSAGLQGKVTGSLGTEVWRGGLDLDQWEPPVPTAFPVLLSGRCDLEGVGVEGKGPCEVEIASGTLQGRGTVRVEVLPEEARLTGTVLGLGGQATLAGGIKREDLATRLSVKGRVPLAGVGVPGEGWVRVAAEVEGTPEHLTVSGALSAPSLQTFNGELRGLSAPFNGTVEGGSAELRATVS